MKAETFGKVYSALAQTEAGDSLKNSLRWSTKDDFRTSETDEEWKLIFGATGQVFTHSVMFYNLSKWFAQKEKANFTNLEAKTFLYGTGIHDIGEAKVGGKGVGDVIEPLKNKSHEKIEHSMAHAVIDSLDLSRWLKMNLHYGYEQVVEGKNPKLNFYFKALEKSEYVFTAMKVYQNSRKLEAQGKKGLTLLKPMVGRVLVFDLAKVLDVYAPAFPNSIGKIFRKSSQLIDEMFVYTIPWLISNTEWMGKVCDHSTLAKNFVLKWEAFKNSQNP